MITDTDELEIQDESQWSAQFATTPTSAFDALIEEGLALLTNGETSEFDPRIEDD